MKFRGYPHLVAVLARSAWIAALVMMIGAFSTDVARADTKTVNKACVTGNNPGDTKTCNLNIEVLGLVAAFQGPENVKYYLKCTTKVDGQTRYFSPAITGYRPWVEYKRAGRTVKRGCRNAGWDDANGAQVLHCINMVVAKKLKTAATITCTRPNDANL